MVQNAPEKFYRKNISIIDLMDMFPDEGSARKWFESVIWPDGVECPHCGSQKTNEVKNHKPMPHRCHTCRKFFSVRKNTLMEDSAIELRKWAIAIYMASTNLKNLSSMKLHQDLRITQKSAWFLIHRIREAFPFEGDPFSGPVEVDETYMGGKQKNMSKQEA